MVVMGPESTPYEGGFFKAVMKFPETFPNMPPDMIFTSEMWHPNVYEDGKVCISILHPPGVDEHNAQETAEEVRERARYKAALRQTVVIKRRIPPLRPHIHP